MKGTDYFAEELGNCNFLEAKDGQCKSVNESGKKRSITERTRFHSWRRHIFVGGSMRLLMHAITATTLPSQCRSALTFFKPSVEGDVLTAESVRVSDGKTMGLYQVTVKNREKTGGFLFWFSI